MGRFPLPRTCTLCTHTCTQTEKTPLLAPRAAGEDTSKVNLMRLFSLAKPELPLMVPGLFFLMVCLGISLCALRRAWRFGVPFSGQELRFWCVQLSP